MQIDCKRPEIRTVHVLERKQSEEKDQHVRTRLSKAVLLNLQMKSDLLLSCLIM